MKTYQYSILFLALVSIMVVAGCVGQDTGDTVSQEENYRTVVDSRGVEVTVPAEINRVVTISDGFILEVMTYLGEEKKVVGVGSRTFQEIDNYTFPTVSGEEYNYSNGMNTMTYLHPWTMELPVIAEFGAGVNYESLAALNPDVVIIRLGSCTFWTNDENVQKSIKTIESLGIPVVVLYGTDFYEQPDMSHLWDEINIIGQVFGKEEKAKELSNYLAGQIDLVKQRTQGISEEEKPNVLYFGLAYVARDEGGAGNTVSLKSFESWTIEEIVNARNAFREDSGYWHVINAEQVLAINPDVIVLPTDWGYHPTEELYKAPYYQNIQELDAIKNRRVTSLAWTPYDCAKRLEYPIEVMIIAKAAYPERFEDIDLGEWILDFYQQVYKVDRQTARGLASAQWLDWAMNDQTTAQN